MPDPRTLALGITESLRLEKTPRMIESSPEPGLVKPSSKQEAQPGVCELSQHSASPGLGHASPSARVRGWQLPLSPQPWRRDRLCWALWGLRPRICHLRPATLEQLQH